MLEINLTPPELRKKKKKSLLPEGFNIPREVVIGSVGGLFILLVIIQIFLIFTNFSRIAKKKKLDNNWEQLAPQKAKVDSVLNEVRMLKNKQNAITSLSGDVKIIWSEKLNLISDSLPRGAWLRKISLEEGLFFIEGSAISRQKEEMINVHDFTSRLKKSEKFLKHLKSLELGSIQRRSIKAVEIADFLITVKLDNDLDVSDEDK